MLMGGTSSVFGFSNWDSLLSHGIPISFFVLTCVLCKTDNQLLFAKILSLGYGLFIITVCVMGITLQLQEDGHLSPSALFLILLVSIFVLAAILHPLEGICLLYGLGKIINSDWVFRIISTPINYPFHYSLCSCHSFHVFDFDHLFNCQCKFGFMGNS